MPAFGYTTEGGFDVSPFIDMINGGGPGRSGDVFEGGGILSALANAVATPYGSQRQRRGMPQFPGAPDPMDPLYGAVTGAFDEITPRSGEIFPMIGGEEPGEGFSPDYYSDLVTLSDDQYAVLVGLPARLVPPELQGAMPGDQVPRFAVLEATGAILGDTDLRQTTPMTSAPATVPATVPPTVPPTAAGASEPRDLFERDYAGMPVSGVTVTDEDIQLLAAQLPFDAIAGDMLLGAEALDLQRARNAALGSAQPNSARNYAGSGMTPATAYVPAARPAYRPAPVEYGPSALSPAAQIMFEGTDGAYAGMIPGAGRQPGMPLEFHPSELSQAEYDQVMAEMRVAYPGLPEPELETLARNFGFLP